MNNKLFDEMLEKYEIRNVQDRMSAMREIMQIVALAGLSRGGFFDRAAFYGGTCLKICYGLDRYSEDLDFSLLTADEKFSLEEYFDYIIQEFSLLGKKISITEKKKSIETTINSAFLKDNTQIYTLNGDLLPQIKIKMEIDTKPPQKFNTEYKLSLQPYSFMMRCYDLPSSYAGKMHALINRKWKNRVKGRDFYDFEWYVRKGIVMDLNHYNERCIKFNNQEKFLTEDEFRKTLEEHIRNVDFTKAKEDVIPFITDSNKLDIWSAEYFLQIAQMMKIK